MWNWKKDDQQSHKLVTWHLCKSFKISWYTGLGRVYPWDKCETMCKVFDFSSFWKFVREFNFANMNFFGCYKSVQLCYKTVQLFVVTNRYDRCYKSVQLFLLQIGTTLLQIGTGVTNRYNFVTNRYRCYKSVQLLQIGI